MTFVFFLVAFILWLNGYLLTTGSIIKQGLVTKRAKVVSTPKWLYYLCGAPKSNRYPIGAMTTTAFRSQIAGIILAICTLMILWKPSQNSLLLGLGLSAVLPYVITYYVDKYYAIKK
jgi:hypothetical protein